MNSVKSAILERLELIRNLDEDHGGEGEKAPKQASFDIAKEIIESQYIGKPFMITVSDAGDPVFEFHGNHRYEFADLTVLDDGTVSCYKKGLGEDSEQFETHYTSNKFAIFFEQLVE